MSLSIEDLAERRRKWVEAERENGANEGMIALLTQLYPDRAHFIYELLQNAEDAGAAQVRFFLHDDRIEFEHDGKDLFSVDNVDAITNIGRSTKLNDEPKIGQFGVGFKAVYAYTDTPEISSGEFHFRIKEMRVPEIVTESYTESGRRSIFEKTRFVLPFNNPKKPPSQAVIEIARLLKGLNSETLLFLTNIRRIEYCLPESLEDQDGCIERIDCGDGRFEIRVQQPNGLHPTSSWFLKFDKEVQVEDQEGENEGHTVKNCRIAVAFGMAPLETKEESKKKIDDGKSKEKSAWQIIPLNPGRLCIYFPADKEKTGLLFHLHAPFAPSVARDSIRDCFGNDSLRNHLAELLAESMHKIRDQGLLTVRTLAVLPNEKDNLYDFKPLRIRLVEEFKKQDLLPMKSGGHAAASGKFRGQKTLTDLIDDSDLSTLIEANSFLPMWVANPPQRNQREDNFLTMLQIKEWTGDDLVNALADMDDQRRITWMNGKDETWHQKLYAFLGEDDDCADNLEYLNFIRNSDGSYRKGSDCFFPADDMEGDDKFPRVARGVYTSGKDENKKARYFLERVGVREVDEAVEIEAIIETYYTSVENPPNCKQHYSHLRRFIRFLESNPSQCNIFYYAFPLWIDKVGQIPNVELAKATKVYLDEPFMPTGLRNYHESIKEKREKHPLSRRYEKSGIAVEKIGEFAKKIGAESSLAIEYISEDASWEIKDNPQWSYLDCVGGNPYAARSIVVKNDWKAKDSFKIWLQKPTVDSAMLIWKSCNKWSASDRWNAVYQKEKRYGCHEALSQLVHTLRDTNWVPQKDGRQIKFVMPKDAVAEKLPKGFFYQTGWQWLIDLDFGKGVEERREALRRKQEKATAEYKRKEEVARDLGFDSLEEAIEMARLKKEDPEGFKSLRSRNKETRFPSKRVANPERRQEHLIEQLSDLANKEYEKRERSVRISNGTIDPITWLRNQYTNVDDQMVCQICKQEMPFRKRNGEPYFEKKEVLSNKYLPKEHAAQYLALCPLCAAKYEEFVKSDDTVMAELKQAIVRAEDWEITIKLDEEETSIRFVEKHFLDLKTIIEDSES